MKKRPTKQTVETVETVKSTENAEFTRTQQWEKVATYLAAASTSLKTIAASKAAHRMVKQLDKMGNVVNKMAKTNLKFESTKDKRAEKVVTQFVALQKRAKTLGVDLYQT